MTTPIASSLPMACYASLVGTAPADFQTTHAFVAGSHYQLSANVPPWKQSSWIPFFRAGYPDLGRLTTAQVETLLQRSEIVTAPSVQRSLEEMLAYAQETPRFLDAQGHILPLWNDLLADPQAATPAAAIFRTDLAEVLKGVSEISPEVAETLNLLIELEATCGGMARETMDHLEASHSPRLLRALLRRASADRLIAFENLPRYVRIALSQQKIEFRTFEDLLWLVAYHRQEGRDDALQALAMSHNNAEIVYHAASETLSVYADKVFSMPTHVSELLALHLFDPESYPPADRWLADHKPESLYRGFRVRFVKVSGDQHAEWIGSKDGRSFTPNIESDVATLRALSADAADMAVAHLRELQYGTRPLTRDEIEQWRNAIREFQEAQTCEDFLFDIRSAKAEEMVVWLLAEFRLYRYGVKTRMEWPRAYSFDPPPGRRNR
ncbi:MAG: hypothetical protein HY540_04730 [Deltaproteobacteria bacterium]|nr:hypothetical protein [Deltaproteobacteria bacterium]